MVPEDSMSRSADSYYILLDDDSNHYNENNIDKSNEYESWSMDNPGPSDETSKNQTEIQETQNKDTDLPSSDTAATVEKETELDQEFWIY